MKQTTNTEISKITLKPFQYDFLYSQARHPAYVAGWNTGKTMCAISRSRIYSKLIPENLGVIFRKTFRSLQDSTLKDFEKYTRLKVNGERNLIDSNGSITMFRHIDELDSINQQNINLGWFYIEQGEELENSEPFFMLFGRLRRHVTPSKDFVALGLPERSGWVIANAGDHWMRPLWKDNGLIDVQKKILPECKDKFAELIEATTWDCREHAKPDFLDSLKILEQTSPDLYRQYVMNDWNVSVLNKVFKHELISLMTSRHGLLAVHGDIAGVAIDPAGEGADMNVFMSGRGGEVLDVYEKLTMTPTEKAMRGVELCRQINGSFIIIDCDGVGIETYSEAINFSEEYLRGIQVFKFHGSAASEMLLCDRPMYANRRAEAAFLAQRRGYNGIAGVNHLDKQLIEDLEADEYFTNGRGLLQIIEKKDIKEKIKRSPGRGDCWKMLQWAFEQKYEDKVYQYKQTHPGLGLQNYAINDDTGFDVREHNLQTIAIND